MPSEAAACRPPGVSCNSHTRHSIKESCDHPVNGINSCYRCMTTVCVTLLGQTQQAQPPDPPASLHKLCLYATDARTCIFTQIHIFRTRAKLAHATPAHTNKVSAVFVQCMTLVLCVRDAGHVTTKAMANLVAMNCIDTIRQIQSRCYHTLHCMQQKHACHICLSLPGDWQKVNLECAQACTQHSRQVSECTKKVNSCGQQMYA